MALILDLDDQHEKLADKRYYKCPQCGSIELNLDNAILKEETEKFDRIFEVDDNENSEPNVSKLLVSQNTSLRVQMGNPNYMLISL